MRPVRRTVVFGILALVAACLLGLAVEQPVLNISGPKAGKVSISWSSTNIGFALQQTADLTNPNHWDSVSNAPSGVGSFQFDVPVGSNQFFRLSLVTNSSDVPDPNFQDTNGDGIDGDKNKAIFVAAPPFGNDANLGTMLAPVATLEHAIALAASAGKDVYVAAGIYSPAAPLRLASGVSLYGLYDGTTNWGRNAQNVTIITGNSTAILALNISKETHLEGFSIQASAAAGAGQSSYGVLAANGTGDLFVRYNSIVSGNGAAGAPGVPGVNGSPGTNGNNGAAGTCDSGNGFGGKGGTSACSRAGGAGGDGGPEGANNGAHGSFGVGGTLGGAGGPGGNPGGPGGSGNDGLPGQNGSNGSSATNAVNADATGFVAATGGAGIAGAPGNGGGGGGGGGGQGCTFCNAGGGNGGGGGGAGGCAGTPGEGGEGGGGSFALFVFAAKAVVSDNSFKTGTGGAGGPGGSGGLGGSAGIGGAGANNCTGEIGAGGNGGKGGGGGAAGSGAGGPGGPSIAIFYSQSTVTVGTNSFLLGNLGPGGNGGANSVSGAAPDGPPGIQSEVMIR
jgi:hypothetical protein